MAKMKVSYAALAVVISLVWLGGACVRSQNITDDDAGHFNCHRPGMECFNTEAGSTCGEGGTCTCADGFEGYNCYLNSSMVKENCTKSCGDGVCYETEDDSTACACPDTHTGEECETPRLKHSCFHDSMEFSIAPLSDDLFEGDIYLEDQEQDENCILEQGEDGAWSKIIMFDECGGAENITDENGDTLMTFNVKVQHSKELIQETDEMYSFVCRIMAPGSNFSWEETGIENQVEDENLPSKKVETDLQPIEQRLLLEDGEEVTSSQKLGTTMMLEFTLNAGDVYDSFRVERITAWNGLDGDSSATYDLVDGGCVTEKAAKKSKVVVDFKEEDEKVILTFRLFRLKGSYQLNFKNVVKVCKTTADCNATVCEHGFEGVGRKRRDVTYILEDAGGDERLQGTTHFRQLNKTVFVLHEQLYDHPHYIALEGQSSSSATECMKSSAFIIICIAVAILALLALAVFAVFCVRMIHRRDERRDFKE